MKLGTYLATIIAYCAAAICVAAPKGDPEKRISGVYKDQQMTFEFKGDKCFGRNEGKVISESHVKVKGNLVYISPNIPDMKKMTRNVWVVWEIQDDKIISKYLVDMDDGTKFYEDQAGKIVLTKQKGESASAEQPGPKPAEKPPVKEESSTPTPKESSR